MGIFRFALAFLVVLQHIIHFPGIGKFAVTSFFLLSGYLMTCICVRNYGYGFAGFTRFWANRMLRLYPAYFVTLALTVIAMTLLGAQTFSDYRSAIYMPQGASEWVPVLSMVYPAYMPYEVTPRLAPATWALTTELFYYLLISLGLSRSVRLSWIWFAAALAYTVTGILNGQGLHWSYYPVTSGALPFAAGALVYHHKDTIMRVADRAGLSGNRRCLGVMGTSVVVLVGFALASRIPNALDMSAGAEGRTISVLLAASAVPSVIALVACLRLRLSGRLKSFDATLGDFSYPVYISHWTFAAIAAWIVGSDGPGRSVDALVTLAVSVPLMIAFCILLQRFIDPPVQRLRDRIRPTKAAPKEQPHLRHQAP
ncbi:acyltransferase [Roseobacter sp.]|uniref:acyltransferase family protein n=1 Tax=Roseobacter sp. TaxID=1907202 RepID=UPI0032991D88